VRYAHRGMISCKRTSGSKGINPTAGGINNTAEGRYRVVEKIMPRSKLMSYTRSTSQSWFVASTIAGLPHYVHILNFEMFIPQLIDELVVDTDGMLILGEGPSGDELIDHTQGGLLGTSKLESNTLLL